MTAPQIARPPREAREAMFHGQRQDEAYRLGGYEYLASVAMVPRLATVAGFVNALGSRKVLDIGCGQGGLVRYLQPEVAYHGVDISPTAIDLARTAFSSRPSTSFEVADFRLWNPATQDHDATVWAGIGMCWTRRGRRGDPSDWLDVLDRSGQLFPGVRWMVLEAVTPHWANLKGLLGNRFQHIAGCNVNCWQSLESPGRAIRVLRTRTH